MSAAADEATQPPAANPDPYASNTTDPRILAGLQRLNIVGRDPALPTFYRYTEGVHPQLPVHNDPSVERDCYVYLIDATSDGKRRFQDMAKSMQVPGGLTNHPGGNAGMYFVCRSIMLAKPCDKHRLALNGLLLLKEGDSVFARDIHGTGDVNEDILQVLLPPWYVHIA